MKAPFLVPLLVVPVIMISGCTFLGLELPCRWCNTISLENDVVIIKEVQAIPNKVTAPQTVQLIATIQNQGEKPFPLHDTSLPLSNLNIEIHLYDYCTGLFNPPKVKCPGQNSFAHGTSCTIPGSQDTLLPDESTEVVWILEPDSSTRLTTPCNLKISVSYPFITDGLTTVNFINSDEYTRRMAAEGGVSSRSSTVSLGDGPVKAWYELRDRQPIIAAAGDTSEIPILLHVENKGAGNVASGTSSARPEVLMLDTENEINDPPFRTNNQNCDFLSGQRIVKLIQDKSVQPCSIAQLSNKEVSKESTFQLRTKIAYRYEFRKEIKVTVEPEFLP